jgi:hypothetical protein
VKGADDRTTTETTIMIQWESDQTLDKGQRRPERSGRTCGPSSANKAEMAHVTKKVTPPSK